MSLVFAARNGPTAPRGFGGAGDHGDPVARPGQGQAAGRVAPGRAGEVRNPASHAAPAGQSALPIEVRPPAPPAAVSLLNQARHGVAEAGRESDAAHRFISAYLSALRAAAAILAARGRPHRGRARPESVWTLLASAAPELAQWAAFFAANSARRAAAQAGNSRHITADSADELLRNAREFVALAQRAVHPRPAGAGNQCVNPPRMPRQRRR
ncbi:hypothetical protein SAMN05421630_107405 [Prauserella marina]|uniref:Uncharacterized protein n=1 Tax=Prauserella marina TaxID=530584 RepID=A0A1G6U1B2_9PSEU|nr:hypothetical protein DES30_10635 [Prauserella marina]SDD34974.1 hypothetical protein SAMN05421630_107405 [Prauserella marina]